MTPLRAKLRDAIGETVGRGHARAKIVTAAIAAFAERGVAATTVEDILVAADVSRRTFYQHFPDKLAVVHAIFVLVTEQLAATFAAAVAADPSRAIDDALATYLELHRTDREIVRALLVEAQRADSPLFAARMRFRGSIANAVAALIATSAGRAVDPYVAVALVSAVEGLSMELLARRPTRAELARARATIAGLIALACAHPEALPAMV